MPIIVNMVPLDGEPGTLEVGSDATPEVKEGGAGALFASAQVLDHPEMRGAFAFEFDEWGMTTVGEDHVFCRRARAAGFKVHAALGYPCGHVQAVNLKSVYEQMGAA